MNLKIQQDISSEVKAPVLLAGWPGMGHVGIGAIEYIRKKLDAKPFAEIEMSEYFAPEAVVVEESLVHLAELPVHTFYYVQNPELMIFESDAQVGGANGIAVVGQILDLAEQMKVKTIYTAAAFAKPCSYKESVHVFGVANQEDLRDSLLTYEAERISQGEISGLNGLLLGYAKLRGIEAACLLGTIPQYAVKVPNPKASREVVRILGRLLKFDVDMNELDKAVEESEKTMAEMEEKMNQ